MAWRKLIKPGSEAAITRDIRFFLRVKHVFHWKVWQGLGSEKGVADILGIMPKTGQFLAIEVKTEKGKLSPHQIRFLENVEKSGGVAIVARSVGDVMEKIK